MKPIRAAAVQWAPEILDLARGLDKAAAAVDEAARDGAELVVFPETWLLGYPYWASLSVGDPRFHAVSGLLREQAPTRDGEAIERLKRIAQDAKVTLVMGLHEREGGTIYNAMAVMGPDGDSLALHRKLVPTTTEKLVWGQGDGSDMEAVATPFGPLVGLICFEHQMTLARFALGSQRPVVHASLWPGHAFLDPVIDASTRQLGFENNCFVVIAREVMSADRLRAHLPDFGDEPGRWAAHGGSAIAGPNGRYVAEPVFDRETIIHAELDPRAIDAAQCWYDGMGHYARPDVFRLKWDRARKSPVETG